MYTPQRVLVAGSFPDALNVNVALRTYLVAAFRAVLDSSEIVGIPYEDAARTAEEFTPDLTLVFGSAYNDATDYTRLSMATRRSGGKVAFWMHDDPYEFDGNFRVFHLADAIFTNDAASVDFYPPSLPVHHLPMAGFRNVHFRPLTGRAGPELFFCGHVYTVRHQVFNYLAEALPNLDKRAIFVGTGLPTGHVPGWTEQRIANPRLADFYARASATLNIGRDLHFANARFLIRPSTPGPRTFEAAFAGAAQVVFGDGLEITQYFEPEREILLADDGESLVEQINRLTSEPAFSLELGRRAQQRALAEHGYDNRVRKILHCLYD